MYATLFLLRGWVQVQITGLFEMSPSAQRLKATTPRYRERAKRRQRIWCAGWISRFESTSQLCPECLGHLGHHLRTFAAVEHVLDERPLQSVARAAAQAIHQFLRLRKGRMEGGV